MEIKELLYPEDYDFASGRYWRINDLSKLIIDNFKINKKQYREFIDHVLWSRWYGMDDIRKLIYNRNMQDDKNVQEIKQLLNHAKEYENIDFTLNLYKHKPGMRRNTPDTVRITNTDAVKFFHSFLMRLVQITDEPAKCKHNNSGIVKESLDFISKINSSLSKNNKLYFTGLILATCGILDSPEEFKQFKRNYKDYREYIIQSTKAIP